MFRSLLTIAFMALPTAAAVAQGTFEGTIGMNVASDDGKVTPMTYLTKDGKIRFDFAADGQKGAIVIDGAGQKMLVIMDEMRMYMEMALPQAAGRQGRGTTTRAAVRTGRMETIAGYQCEHVTTTDDDGATVDSCVTSELGVFRMFSSGNPMQPPREAGWTSGLGAGSFPLKSLKGDKVLVEVTKVQRNALDAALFAAPAGFRKFAMPGRGGSPD